MVSSATISRLDFNWFLALPVMAALILLQPISTQAQDIVLPEDVDETPQGLTAPSELRILNQEDSILSLKGGQRLMVEAQQATEAQDYERAVNNYQQARQVFNQLSNSYQQLSVSFSGIDNRIYNELRQKALQTGQMRDEATYELAKVHIDNDQPSLAVLLLIQVIRSQNDITRNLGQKAYQELEKLGFADPSATQGDMLLSLAGGERLMAEAQEAVNREDYPSANKKYQEARQILNQVSNLYQQLAESFVGIDNELRQTYKSNALQAAQMRDEATFQLARVHEEQEQPELAVPLLIQIIGSQNPTSDLGQKAYQELLGLGFVQTPFTRRSAREPVR